MKSFIFTCIDVGIVYLLVEVGKGDLGAACIGVVLGSLVSWAIYGNDY